MILDQLMTRAECAASAPADIHTWFGLTYANYLVLERTILQSMPGEWQRQFVELLHELDYRAKDLDRPEAYEVTPGLDTYIDELTDDQRKQLGIVANTDDMTEIECGHFTGDVLYYDRDGNELPGVTHVVLPKASAIALYQRGRTVVPLRRFTDEPA